MKLLHHSRIVIFFAVLFLHAPLMSATIDSQLKDAKEKAHAREYTAALSVYNALLAEVPDHVDALNGKARVLSWMKRYAEAKEVYARVISAHPGNLEALTGMADVHSWENDYDSALKILDGALLDNPDNRDILVRLAKIHLWAGNKDESIAYSDRILKDNPDDSEARNIRKQARALYEYEYFAGYNYLHINNNDDGYNLYTGIRYEPKKNYALYGQLDYLRRFKMEEVRILAGGSLDVSDRLTISAELSGTPDADIYPRLSGWLEIGSPVLPSLVLYGSGNISHYRNVDVYSVSAAAEYYPAGFLSLFGRVTYSKTEFDSGGDSDDTAFMVKATWYINDNDKIFGYYANGNEAFKRETIDTIGAIEAKTYGIGGTYFITPVLGLAPSFEYQDRDGGTEYFQYGLEIQYRL